MLVQHRTFWKIRPQFAAFQKQGSRIYFSKSHHFSRVERAVQLRGVGCWLAFLAANRNTGETFQKCGVLPRTSLKSDRWEDRWEDDRRPIFYLGGIDLNMSFRFIP